MTGHEAISAHDIEFLGVAGGGVGPGKAGDFIGIAGGGVGDGVANAVVAEGGEDFFSLAGSFGFLLCFVRIWCCCRI